MSMRPLVWLLHTRLPSTSIDAITKEISLQLGGIRVDLGNPISVRDNSEIFRVEVRSTIATEIAIKICLIPKTTTPDSVAAKEQFSALKRVHGAMAGRILNYRVPEPLFFIPEQASFAMSWIHGKSLTKKMHTFDVLCNGNRWFEEVGAWLGAFHLAGKNYREKISLDERLAALEVAYSCPLDDKLFLEALDVLKRTAPTVIGDEVVFSWLHGDCKTDNFILDGPIVYGIDISLRYENPVEYDLAQFLNNLEVSLSSPNFMHLSMTRDHLEAAFLEGYHRTGPEISFRYLDWLRLNFATASWYWMLKNKRFSIRNWILNRVFRSTVRKLSAKFEGTL